MNRLCLEPGPMGRAHGSPGSSGPCAVAPHLSRRTGTYSTGLCRRHACILPARVGAVVFVMGMVLPRCAVGSSGDGIPGVASDANPPACRRHGEFPPTVACCSDARPVVCGGGARGVEGPSDTSRHFARGPSLQLTPGGDGGRCNALAATSPPATSLPYTGNSGPAAPASARPCRTQPGEQALSTWHTKSCCGQTRDNRRHMHKRRHGPASSGPCGASGSRIGCHRQAAAQQGVANHIREAIQLHATLAWSGFLANCEHDRRPGERSPIATYSVELRGPDARVPGPRKGPLLARGAADARVPSPREGPPLARGVAVLIAGRRGDAGGRHSLATRHPGHTLTNGRVPPLSAGPTPHPCHGKRIGEAAHPGPPSGTDAEAHRERALHALAQMRSCQCKEQRYPAYTGGSAAWKTSCSKDTCLDFHL